MAMIISGERHVAVSPHCKFMLFESEDSFFLRRLFPTAQELIDYANKVYSTR